MSHPKANSRGDQSARKTIPRRGSLPPQMYREVAGNDAEDADHDSPIDRLDIAQKIAPQINDQTG